MPVVVAGTPAATAELIVEPAAEPAVKATAESAASVEPTEDAAASSSPPPAHAASAAPLVAGADAVVADPAQCGPEGGAAEADLDVTLVVHASADRLWMIPHICDRWGGPMVAVFGGADADGAVQGGWPSADEAALRGAAVNGSLGCSLRRVRPAARAADRDKAYPINWLRNVGIACARTSHYFMVDVDFWPSRSLRRLVRAQLAGWGDAPRAMVVPNFQRNGHGCRNDANRLACRDALAAATLAMPGDFDELQACIGAKECSVFDSEWNAAGQSSTDIGAWKGLAEGATRRVRCLQSARYEPFVVLRRANATPAFDERFYGYGKNKVELLVELRLAGFEFVVLGRGFLIHFPHPKSSAKEKWLHSIAHKKVEQLYSKFGAEVEARYKGVKQRTPLCRGAH